MSVLVACSLVGVGRLRTTQPQSPQRYHRRQVLAQLRCTVASKQVACMDTRSHVTAGSSQRAPMYAQLRSKSCRWESVVRCGTMAAMSVAVSLLSTICHRRPATHTTRRRHSHSHTRQQPHTSTATHSHTQANTWVHGMVSAEHGGQAKDFHDYRSGARRTGWWPSVRRLQSPRHHPPQPSLRISTTCQSRAINPKTALVHSHDTVRCRSLLKSSHFPIAVANFANGTSST